MYLIYIEVHIEIPIRKYLEIEKMNFFFFNKLNNIQIY